MFTCLPGESDVQQSLRTTQGPLFTVQYLLLELGPAFSTDRRPSLQFSKYLHDDTPSCFQKGFNTFFNKSYVFGH